MPRAPRERDFRLARSFSRPYLQEINARAARIPPSRRNPRPTYADRNDREIYRNVQQVARLNDPLNDDRTNYLHSLLRRYQIASTGSRVENRGNLIWIDVAATIEVIDFRNVMTDYVTQIFRMMDLEQIFEHGFVISVAMRVDTERQDTAAIVGLPFKSKRYEINHPIGRGDGARYVGRLINYLELWFQSRNQSFDLHQYGDVRIFLTGLPARNNNLFGGHNRAGNARRMYIPNRFGDNRRPIDIRPGYVGTHIPTPHLLKTRHAIINPLNEDNKCFLWASIISVKHEMLNTNKGYINYYREFEYSLFNMEGIEYPFKIDHQVLRQLERNNPDYAWNIMKWVNKDEVLFPVYRSRWNGTQEAFDKTFINLIYFNNTDEGEDPSKWHFGVIADIKRLVKRCTASGGNNFCWTCGDVITDRMWNSHVKHCRRGDMNGDEDDEYDNTATQLGQDIEFVTDGTRIGFANDYKYLTGLMSPDAIVYADFECYTNTTDNDNVHTVCGYAYILRVKDAIVPLEYAPDFHKADQAGQLADIERRVRNHHYKTAKVPYKTLVVKAEHQQLARQNMAKEFIDEIFNLRGYPEFRKFLTADTYPFPPVPEEQYRFYHPDDGKCETCNMCPGGKLTYYHDTKSGMIYGLVCDECMKILSSRDEQYVPVVFQNGSKYDFHFIIKNLDISEKEKVQIVGDGEVFKTFTVKSKRGIFGGYKFLDSIRYLGPGSSLDNLMKSAKASKHDFPILRQAYEMYTGQPMSEVMFDAFTRKGVFPYDWNTNINCLKHEGLPPKELFYSKLRSEHITDEDYEHAKKVWTHAGMKYFYEYHDLYMLVDTLQLCDFFETYRGNCWEQYGLEVLKYITGPSLFYAAALKHDGGELEFVQNEECQKMFERGVRGGMSMITHRFVELNENDDPGCIRYWDANNLYGWAMRQPLPVGKFERTTYSQDRKQQAELIDTLTAFPLMQWADPDSKFGAFFEVDLKYPAHLHDAHRDYPLAPYHMTPQWKNVSNYTKKFWSEPPSKRKEAINRMYPKTIPPMEDVINWVVNDFNDDAEMYDSDDEVPVRKPTFSSSAKLCSTFWMHEHYVVHARNLKLYLELGMQVVRIHAVMTFEQRPWLRDYIDMNTRKRIEADKCGDGLKKDLFKLANNAVFGKMCENIRDFKEVSLFSDPDEVLETIRSPMFQSTPVTIREPSSEDANDGLYSRTKLKTKLLFNKPIYVGVAILELSKLLMFDFHYNCVKEVFGDSCRLLMTDTDSLVYHFRTCKDPDRLLMERGYGRYLALQPDGSLSITPGLMKNEYHPKPGKEERLITGFVGLRAKTYALRFNDGKKDTMKAKAVPARSMELRNIRYDNYRAVLMSERPKAFRLNGIYSKAQTVKTMYDLKRFGLAASDDKRYILDNGIASVPYGYNPNRMVCDSDDDDYDDEVDRDE